MNTEVLKLFLPGTTAFIIGILLTPFVTSYLYRHQLWKKKAGKVDLSGQDTPIFNSLHKEKEVGTPKMGGIVIWGSTLLTVFGFWLIARFSPGGLAQKFYFLSRSQTFIPVAVLAIGALVGLYDDYLDISGSKDHKAGGLSLKKRLGVVAVIGLACGMWFFGKLGVSTIGLPFGHSLPLGVFFPIFFMLVTMAIYAGGVIDGLDGLAGGIFAAAFTAYGGIAFFQHQYDLAALCSVLVGSILAFLWFNVPPARFYMAETGSMALTLCLTTVVFMTDSLGHGYGILVLPVIGFLLVATVGSVIIQVISKKFRHGKKVFLVAPLHHHFEAKGWTAAKITMRYWILSIVLGMLGLILAVLQMGSGTH